MVDMVDDQAGLRRRQARGSADASRVARSEEKGILDEVLQPGIYPINTEEFEVIPCEVGIYQTTYQYIKASPKSTAITFRGQGRQHASAWTAPSSGS